MSAKPTGKVTMRKLAAALGVSANTVSLALRGSPMVAAKTRRRVADLAEKMGYRRNPIVSQVMSALRRSQAPVFQATLALVNANHDPDALRDHPTIPTYVAGCEARAARQGYRFDRFWLHDRAHKPESWRRTWRARGIRGVVLVGLMDTNELPVPLAALWQEFPCVVTGVRTRNPALPFSCVDHYNLVLTAFERVRALGYQRPGLVMDEVIDVLVERRFSAGFTTGQGGLPRAQRLPIFLETGREERDRARFGRWYDRHQPDVIFTLYNRVFRWLEAKSLRVPGDVGVIQLEWRAARPDIAGMHQHNDLTGEAAVDMIISQIHNQENGLAASQRSTLISATWMDGTSVRSG
jgi:LacI family transcriptional regulator